MKDIQTWLGHSNYSFTANTYVHSSKDCHVQMAQAFSEKLPQLCSPTIEILPSEPIIEGDFEVQKGVRQKSVGWSNRAWRKSNLGYSKTPEI